MLIRLAWRNVLRNRRRSLVTISALALGVCAIVFGQSYVEVFWNKMIAQVTAAHLGHLQVHAAGWQQDPELGSLVTDPAAVEARLSAALPGARPAQRVLGYGLAGSEEQSAAVAIMGLDPAREPDASGPLTLLEGRYLSALEPKGALLGRTLAEQLSIKPGGELVLLGQAADGSMANDRFVVAGLVDAGSDELDGTGVFLNLADAQEFFALGAGVHQILIRLPTDEQDVSAQLAALRGALDPAELEALSWDQMAPELKTIVDQKRQGLHAISAIVFFIVALGVLNAMTMATFERTREFGVMASLGTRRGRILRLVVTEALLQGLVGLALGLALATVVAAAVGTMDLSALAQGDMVGARMPSQVEMELRPGAVVSASVTVMLTVVAGGLWPAWRASRLKPVVATRYV